MMLREEGSAFACEATSKGERCIVRASLRGAASRRVVRIQRIARQRVPFTNERIDERSAGAVAAAHHDA